MPLNEFDDFEKGTLRQFGSAVATGFQTATNAINCGGANHAYLAVRTVLGNATLFLIKPQFTGDQGSTWYTPTNQAITGITTLATPLQHKVLVSDLVLVQVSLSGDRMRIQTRAQTLATGAKIGVELWLNRK